MGGKGGSPKSGGSPKGGNQGPRKNSVNTYEIGYNNFFALRIFCTSASHYAVPVSESAYQLLYSSRVLRRTNGWEKMNRTTNELNQSEIEHATSYVKK
jgi:hypothetical protein